jgi:hypothetical protein
MTGVLRSALPAVHFLHLRGSRRSRHSENRAPPPSPEGHQWIETPPGNQVEAMTTSITNGSGALGLLVVIAVAAGIYNATQNRVASDVEFFSCWQALEIQDMRAHGVTSTTEMEIRTGPSIDACLAAKDLFITKESAETCKSNRLPGCYRRPWLLAAVK